MKVWQESIDGGFNWFDIPGTYQDYEFTGYSGYDTLVLTGVTPGMSDNKYRVRFQCNIVSNAAGLTVVNLPSIITAQPTDVSACVGSNAGFNINVSGSSLSYQWQLSTDGGANFSDISGAVSSQLQLNAVTQSMNGYKYRSVVSSSCSPTLTSSTVTLTVATDNTIVSTQPSAQQACGINSSATFTVALSGQPIAYQWQRAKYNSTLYSDIPGASTASSVLTGLNNNNDRDNVRCKATRSCGSFIYSNAALLRVFIDPVIYQQPANAQSCVGSTATFKIWVDSIVFADAFYAQWEQSADGGITYTNASGTINFGSDYATRCSYFTITVPVSSAAMNNYKYVADFITPDSAGIPILSPSC